MSLTEIKEAIAKLSPDERRELIRSFTSRVVELTPEEQARIQKEADAIPEDEWIDWEDLKAESSAGTRD